MRKSAVTGRLVGYRNQHYNEAVTLVVEELAPSPGGVVDWGTDNDASDAVGVLWCWPWVGGRSGGEPRLATAGPYARARARGGLRSATRPVCRRHRAA